MEDKKDKTKDYTIDDFNQEYRDLLEQGINLLRYGLEEDEIEEFINACIKETEMDKYINSHMNIWGAGQEYE